MHVGTVFRGCRSISQAPFAVLTLINSETGAVVFSGALKAGNSQTEAATDVS